MKKKTKTGLYAKCESILVFLAAAACVVIAVSSIAVLRQGLQDLHNTDNQQRVFISQLEINSNNARIGNIVKLPEWNN